jgi:hypothetical protein
MGDQGAVAIAEGAKALFATTLGSRDKYSGIGGGPSGLPRETEPRARLTEDFFFIIGFPEAVGSKPWSIQSLIKASFGAAILSPFGGMYGSFRREGRRWSKLFEDSPGRATSPELPPARIPFMLVRSSPPFALSGLWQELQDSSKSGRRSSSKFGFSGLEIRKCPRQKELAKIALLNKEFMV